MNRYEEALQRVEFARRDLRIANRHLGKAQTALDDAERELEACEERPGIPKPEYRGMRSEV